MSNIWKTGLTADARYSKFDSAFAIRDLQHHHPLQRYGGQSAPQSARRDATLYYSSLAANSTSNFVNLIFDTNLGSRLFVESMFTAQRGGTLDYNQWTTTLGYRFDNRASTKEGGTCESSVIHRSLLRAIPPVDQDPDANGQSAQMRAQLTRRSAR